MDRETLQRIWREAERVRSGRAIDFASLVSAAAELGPVSWHDAAELALQVPHGEAGRPMHMLEFVAKLGNSLRPQSILDSWVGTPTILAAAHEASGSTRSCGLVWNERIWEAAQVIAPLDWRHGDPLLLLRDLLDERFDLVLAAPPVGLRLPIAAEPGDPRGRVESADLVLWRAAHNVAEGGHVLFHTTDNYFWSQSRRRFWTELGQRGLHPQAVVSIDRALSPWSSIATSLVLFGSEPPRQLFVGRLDQGTSVSMLVRNLIAHRAADDPYLGALVAADAFRGWRPFVLEQELAGVFGTSELRPLADIGRVRRVHLKPGVPYERPTNCVWVPTLGFGNVMTAPPELEGRSGYRLLEVQLDPAVARAEYVASLLSSPTGKLLRESVSGGMTIPNVAAFGVEGIRIPVPSMTVQAEAVRTDAHLASMQATVARLRGELWRRPEDAPRALSQLEMAARADPVRRWLETLPYPLASVLQRYTALREPVERLTGLLHFYEAMAEFGCAVLLSILRADRELLVLTRPEIANAAGRGRDLFDRADFGLWINLGSTLAKAIRRLSGQAEQRRRLEEAAGPATELMARLAARELWPVLDQARVIRNARAHGGVLSPVQVETWLGTLEVLLSDAEQALGSGFDDVDLARADQGRFVACLHVYPRAQRLRGPGDVFEEFEVRTRTPLESGHLVFVGRDAPISTVLVLVPLVRVGAGSGARRNACYFFESRTQGGKFSYVSYHFEDEPRIEVVDGELQQLALDLR
jgi:hypothetical protein